MEQWEQILGEGRGVNKPIVVADPTSLMREVAYVGWPYLILSSAILLVSAFFLWPSYREFPMDDSYIHFVYAENLASHGKIFFSYANEQGLGVTSPLWVLILSGGRFLGAPVHLTAKVVGVLSLVIVSSLIHDIAASYWPRVVALGAALLVGLSGNMLWFALSGMETVLFLAAGMCALWFYHRQRMILLGVSLGLLILLRPEGLALVAAIFLLELVRKRVLRRDLWVMLFICVLICAPWFFYVYWRTGYFLPTSAIGKQISFQTAIQQVTSRNPSLSWLGQFSAIVYVGSWLIYLLLFALGGLAFPGPTLEVGELVNNPDYVLSLWSMMGLILIILPLLFAVVRRAWVIRERLFRGVYFERPAILALILWTVIHNVLYMVYMPAPGTASRYGAINYIFLWVILVLGLFIMIRHKPGNIWFLAGLLIIALTNTWYWNKVYDANLDHMHKVRIAAAKYLKQHDSSEVCATFDVGAIRYYSERPIVDLGGLMDPAATHHFLSGTYDRYLLDQGVTCLILPGRMNTTQEGWFDMAHTMGFDNSPLFDLQQIAVLEIDRDRWLLGYLPTNNYQSSVIVYRVEPSADQ